MRRHFLSLLDFIFVVGDKRNFDNFDWRKKCDRALEYNMSGYSTIAMKVVVAIKMLSHNMRI